MCKIQDFRGRQESISTSIPWDSDMISHILLELTICQVKLALNHIPLELLLNISLCIYSPTDL